MSTKDAGDFFDEQLLDPEYAVEYLKASVEEEDPRHIVLALGKLMQAHGGPNSLAPLCGINRQHLYKIMNGDNLPKLDTLIAICRAMKISLSFEVESA